MGRFFMVFMIQATVLLHVLSYPTQSGKEKLKTTVWVSYAIKCLQSTPMTTKEIVNPNTRKQQVKAQPPLLNNNSTARSTLNPSPRSVILSASRACSGVNPISTMR